MTHPTATRGVEHSRRPRPRPGLTTGAPLSHPLVTALILVAALLLVAVVLSGCGDDGPAATSAPTSITAGVTTTTVTAPEASTSSTLGGDGPVPGTDQGSATTVTYSPPYTGTTQPGVPLPPFESSAIGRELIRTMEAIQALAARMEEAGTPSDDSVEGTVFALRARAQALTARRALVDGRLPLADDSVGQLGHLLTQAAMRAEDPTAEAVRQAQGRMTEMVLPSQDGLRAASTLDHVIADLAPLVDHATDGD